MLGQEQGIQFEPIWTPIGGCCQNNTDILLLWSFRGIFLQSDQMRLILIQSSSADSRSRQSKSSLCSFRRKNLLISRTHPVKWSRLWGIDQVNGYERKISLIYTLRAICIKNTLPVNTWPLASSWPKDGMARIILMLLGNARNGVFHIRFHFIPARENKKNGYCWDWTQAL